MRPRFRKNWNVAVSPTAITSFPASRSAFLKIDKKRVAPPKTYDALAPGGSFIIYQVTNELRQHATLFEHAESEYCLQNIPPMFILFFRKTRRERSDGDRVPNGAHSAHQSA